MTSTIDSLVWQGAARFALPAQGACTPDGDCTWQTVSLPVSPERLADGVVVAALLTVARRYADTNEVHIGLRRNGSLLDYACAMSSSLLLQDHLSAVSAGLEESSPLNPEAGIPSLFYAIGDSGRVSGADLVVSLESTSGGMLLHADFHEHVHSPAFVEALLSHLSIVAEQILDHPQRTMAEARLLSDTEVAAWELFNETTVAYPRDALIFDLFAEKAAAAPDRVAVLHGETSVTYRELLESAERLAAVLHAHGVRPADRVALEVSRTPILLAALLAILRLGAAYVPIDPQVPPARREYLLTDSGATLFLTDAGIEAGDVPVLNLSAPFETPDSLALPDLTINAEDPAYVMYTSGTTGRPKGVVVNQRAVVRLVRDGAYAGLSTDTRILQTGAIGFDATTFEFWGPLLNGGAVILVPGETILSAAELRAAIGLFGANTIFVTTGLFNQLIEQDPAVFGGCTVLFGGEYASAGHLSAAMEACPDANFVHVYGPTENTTFSLAHPVAQVYGPRIPIGRPIANSTAWVLDQDRNLQPIGVPGELYVGGDGLAVGYLNLPELDAQAFVTRRGSAQRLYRTGDVVVLNPASELEFIGRADDQVKIRGYRVELGEIESQLAKVDGVNSAVVLFRRNENGLAGLCGFFTASRPLEIQNIRTALGSELPDYMVPATFAQVDTMPLTANLKVDRKELAKLWPDGAGPAGNNGDTSMTPLEASIAEIFAEVLNVAVIDVDADFFALGGHSLGLMRVQNRIKKRLGAEVRLREILAAPTVRGIAVAAAQASADSAD